MKLREGSRHQFLKQWLSFQYRPNHMKELMLLRKSFNMVLMLQNNLIMTLRYLLLGRLNIHALYKHLQKKLENKH